MKLKFLFITLLFLFIPLLAKAQWSCNYDSDINVNLCQYSECGECGAGDCLDNNGCTGLNDCPPACPKKAWDGMANEFEYICYYGLFSCINGNICRYSTPDVFHVSDKPCSTCQANGTRCHTIECTDTGWKYKDYKCDTNCPGVDPLCNGLGIGESCGDGKVCNNNCQCVGEVPPPPPPPGACKTGPTYTCPPAMKCPTCPEELQGGLVPCGRSCDDPCTAECECAPCTLCHLFVLFKRIIDFLAKDVLFPLAVLMIVIGGVMFLTAAGDPGRIGTAKKILTSVVIGLLIIFLAWLIVDTIIMFITNSGSPFRNWKDINCPLPEEAAAPGPTCTPGTCDTDNRIYCKADGTWTPQDDPLYCSNCTHCTDSATNCGETGLNCGGGGCPDCACATDADCSSPTPFCRNGNCTIEGDVNGDCVVDLTDWNLCKQHYGTNWPPCDWNKDGIVGLYDTSVVSQNQGHTCP